MVFLRVHSVVPSCQMSSSNRSRSDRREFTEGLSYLFSISRAWSRTVRIYAAIASLGFALGAGGMRSRNQGPTYHRRRAALRQITISLWVQSCRVRGASKIQRTTRNCSNRILINSGTLDASFDCHISGNNASGTLPT